MSVTSAQVTTLLENVLFESATLAAQNATSWTAIANLNSSTSTVAGLSAYMATQPEAQIAARVVEYYQGALARVPSAFEINYYVQQAEQGLNASTIAQGTGPAGVPLANWVAISHEFAASPEFQADFGLTGGITASNAGLVVTGFYTNILGRAPTSAEIQFYVNELTTGVPASALLQQFTESPEYQNKAAATIQANLSSSGVAAVATVAAGGDPLAQGGAPIGGLPSATNTNFVLTTGVDTLSGGNGANTFIGALDSTAGVATLGGADTVTGVGGANTLLLTDAVLGDKSTLPVGASITNIETVTLKTAGNAGDLGGAAAFDVSGITGVTQVNVTSSGTNGDLVAAASTTSISDTNVGGSNVTTQGGNNITVSTSGTITVGGGSATDPAGTITATETGTNTVNVDGGTTVTVNAAKNAQINVDQNDASSGAITVNATGNDGSSIFVGTGSSAAAGTVTVVETGKLASGDILGNVTIVGGTTVTVTANITPSSAAAAAQATSAGFGVLGGGTISVTGSKATTIVTVTQTASVAGVTGTTAVPAVPGAAAVAGAPGKDPVAAGAGTAAVPFAPGSFGVVDGAVNITDANGTITTVSLTNYGAGSSFNGNALTTLNLSGTAGSFTITDAAATGTTLALNLNGVSAGFNNAGTAIADGITDASAKIKTINVVTSGATSKLTTISDTALTTLNVSGTAGGLTLTGGVTGDAALTTVAVSGAASFSDGGTLAAGLASIAGLTTITTSSSGKFTAALNDTVQSFTGSTGQDVITINGLVDATKTITAGSATNNELVVSTTGAAAYALTAATAAKVTGFQQVGLALAGTVASTVDMSVLDATASNLEIISAPGAALTVTKLATGANLAIDVSTGNAITVGFVDANGSSDSTTLTLGKANALTVSSLTLQDANAVGITNLTVTQTSATADQIITTLVDTDLSHLTVSGGDKLSIGTLTESTNATQLNIVDNDVTGVAIGTLTGPTIGSLNFSGTGSTTITAFAPTATVTTLSLADTGSHPATITTLTDSALGTINFSGTAAVKIGTLAGDTVTTLSLTNSGTGADSIGAFTDAALTNLNVSGSVKLGSDDGVAANGIQLGAAGITGGITVAASTDNAHINVKTLGLTAAGSSDTITVGNGNDQITDVTTAGHVNVTVGTGSNLIDVHTGSALTYLATITLGAHTSADEILVSSNTTSGTPAATTVINGAAAGDILGFNDTPTSVVALSAANQTNVTAASSLAAAVNLVDGLAGTVAHSATVFTYGGNTYVIESVAAGTGTVQTGDSIVELVGTHTATSITTGHLILAS